MEGSHAERQPLRGGRPRAADPQPDGYYASISRFSTRLGHRLSSSALPLELVLVAGVCIAVGRGLHSFTSELILRTLGAHRSRYIST